MTTDLTLTDLDALAALLERATPGEGPDGEWFLDEEEAGPHARVFVIRRDLGSDIQSVGTVAYRELGLAIAALRNAAPDLLRFARRGLEAAAQRKTAPPPSESKP